ncbi:MAG TPA: LamG domain-containing protein, partial [Kofleriaceae bacterium]|nr:LamG domain-containing protein [Kofleriaceae bacterium]
RTVSQPEPTFYAADGPTYAHAFATGVNVTNSTWYYVVGTYDAATGTSSIYVNGVLAGTSTMTGPIDYLLKPVQIGCSPSGWWMGAIDEVTISTGARSAGQIAAEYANQVDPAAFVTIAPTEPAN